MIRSKSLLLALSVLSLAAFSACTKQGGDTTTAPAEQQAAPADQGTTTTAPADQATPAAEASPEAGAAH